LINWLFFIAADTVTISQKSQWTVNGIVWTQDAKKKHKRTRMSKRFRSLFLWFFCLPSLSDIRRNFVVLVALFYNICVGTNSARAAEKNTRARKVSFCFRTILHWLQMISAP